MAINQIPEGWRETIISDVADVNELSVGNNYPYQLIEYIDISSVGTREVLSTQKLSLADAPSRAKRIIRDNDILISTVRPNLKHFCFIKIAKPNHVASTGFAVISSKKCDPIFLYYLLTTHEYTGYLIKIADSQTSTYPAFNSGVISNSVFAFPSLPEQKAIADVLSSFDNKIELLRKQNKTLEAIAQTIFNEWFDRFNFPNENGKPYQVSGGKMIASELGLIPEGWRVGKLEEICCFDPRERVNKNEKYLFFDMKCLSTNSMVIEQGIYKQANSGSMFKKGDTLMAKITPCLENGKTGFVFDIDNNKIALGSTEFIVLRAKEDCSPYYIYCLSRSEYLRDQAIKSMNGTSGRQRVQIDQLKNVKVIINTAVFKLFDKTMKPEFKKIQYNISQIQTLSALRDELLSKLMKGELRVFA